MILHVAILTDITALSPIIATPTLKLWRHIHSRRTYLSPISSSQIQLLSHYQLITIANRAPQEKLPQKKAHSSCPNRSAQSNLRKEVQTLANPKKSHIVTETKTQKNVKTGSWGEVNNSLETSTAKKGQLQSAVEKGGLPKTLKTRKRKMGKKARLIK